MILRLAALVALAGPPTLSMADYVRGGSLTRESQQQRPVVVALVPQLPDSTARVVVLRRKQMEPSEVILLRESHASASDLAAAIALLLRSRAVDGDDYPHAMRMTVRMSAAVRETPRQAALFLSQALERLHRAPVRTVPGIGTVRAITLELSRFRHRGG